MPRKSTLALPPLDFGGDSVPRRLARLRKERGLTQVSLAARIGITQALVSDYETGHLRLSAEMAVRFALALNASLDELLHPRPRRRPARTPRLRLVRRMQLIEKLPPRRQAFVLSALDSLLRGAATR